LKLPFIGKGKEEQDREQALHEDIVRGQTMPNPSISDEGVASLGSSVYMVIDPDVLQIINEHKELKAFRILVSHLNRLTKKDKRTMDLDTLDTDYQVLIHKLNMNEDDYENEMWGLLEALRMFLRSSNCDSIDGFKARVVTEQIKVIKTQLEQVKKKVLPF
jgi:hypothetical protein